MWPYKTQKNIVQSPTMKSFEISLHVKSDFSKLIGYDTLSRSTYVSWFVDPFDSRVRQHKKNK